MKIPKISVVMAVYNEEKFLEESVDSILNQTFKDWELVIVNDCSTDNSLNIIKSYMKKDKRIRLVNNKKNGGCPDSRNDGLKISKGEYIAILDGDDVSHPKRLEKEVNYLEKNPHIFLVGSSAVYINEEGKEIRRFRKYNDHEMLAWRLPQSCGIVHSSIMFRNEGLIYNNYFKGASDYKFYLDLLSKGKNLTNLPEFLVRYRLHGGSMSISGKEMQEGFSNEAKEQIDFKSKFRIRFLPKLFIHYIKTINEKREKNLPITS